MIIPVTPRVPAWLWLAIALTVSLGANVIQWSIASAHDAVLEAEKGKVTAAVDANASLSDAVTDLQTRLEACVGQADMIEQLAQEALSDLERARSERQRLSAERRALMEQAYAADPTCAAWAAGAVCAGVSDRL